MKRIFNGFLPLLIAALLLTSVGAMGLEGFTDRDQVDPAYADSVEVLAQLEILNGFEDHSFRPVQTITRAQMAKMIAVLSCAGHTPDQEDPQSVRHFTDVPQNQWYVPYVAYCTRTGIVAGVSSSAFQPEGQVTGVQTAKMLLVCLGFDPEEQGYVGGSWRENVLLDAERAGLWEGLAESFSADAPITRQEAAQMMANALKAPVILESLQKQNN